MFKCTIEVFLFRFFMTGLLPVGFELAAELTYPEPEATSAGLLNAASQVFGIAFTSIYSVLLNNIGDVWANASMSAMLAVGTVLISFVSSKNRRQEAQKAHVDTKDPAVIQHQEPQHEKV